MSEPLTDAEERVIREHHRLALGEGAEYQLYDCVHDIPRLLNELDRMRAEREAAVLAERNRCLLAMRDALAVYSCTCKFVAAEAITGKSP